MPVPALSPATASSIHLVARMTLEGHSDPEPDKTTTLAEKMDELFAAGYTKDDLFGTIVPLLMEGKVRIDMAGLGSERLELMSTWLKLPRSAAISVFDEYVTRRPLPKDVTPRFPHKDTIRITVGPKFVIGPKLVSPEVRTR